MDKIKQIMDEYFATVTPEQFEKDLRKAGIENLPNKKEFKWWYMECPLCANRDSVGWCTRALWKPKATVDGVCMYFSMESK